MYNINLVSLEPGSKLCIIYLDWLISNVEPELIKTVAISTLISMKIEKLYWFKPFVDYALGISLSLNCSLQSKKIFQA